MRVTEITAAEADAHNLLEKIRELRDTAARYEKETPPGQRLGRYLIIGTKESGALRRASMDLTRALSKMRKP